MELVFVGYLLFDLDSVWPQSDEPPARKLRWIFLPCSLTMSNRLGQTANDIHPRTVRIREHIRLSVEIALDCGDVQGSCDGR